MFRHLIRQPLTCSFYARYLRNRCYYANLCEHAHVRLTRQVNVPRDIMLVCSFIITHIDSLNSFTCPPLQRQIVKPLTARLINCGPEITRTLSHLHQLSDVRRCFAVSSQPDLSQEVRELSFNRLPDPAFWMLNCFLVRRFLLMRGLITRSRSLSPRKKSLSTRSRSLSTRSRSLSPRSRSLSPRRRNG